MSRQWIFASIEYFIIVRMLYNTYNRLLFYLLLFFHLMMVLVSLWCWIWRKMKKSTNKTITSNLSTYDFKIMKKKKEKGHDKNRFCDKLMCLLWYVLYNTYDEWSFLFSCQYGSRVEGGRGGVTKKTIQVRFRRCCHRPPPLA